MKAETVPSVSCDPLPGSSKPEDAGKPAVLTAGLRLFAVRSVVDQVGLYVEKLFRGKHIVPDVLLSLVLVFTVVLSLEKWDLLWLSDAGLVTYE